MSVKKIIFIFITAFILGFFLGTLIKQDSIEDNGRLYPSKSKMCQEFAQSYLKTIQKTDNITDFGSDKWNMAVNIETELYKLCLLDLNKEALKNYKLTAFEKQK